MYTTRDFLVKYPNTVQAVTNAIVEAERWMAHATPKQVAAAVPQQYALAEKEVFARAYADMQKLHFARRPDDRRCRAYRTRVLTAFDPEIGKASIDLKATYDNRFVESADKR